MATISKLYPISLIASSFIAFSAYADIGAIGNPNVPQVPPQAAQPTVARQGATTSEDANTDSNAETPQDNTDADTSTPPPVEAPPVVAVPPIPVPDYANAGSVQEITFGKHYDYSVKLKAAVKYLERLHKGQYIYTLSTMIPADKNAKDYAERFSDALKDTKALYWDLVNMGIPMRRIQNAPATMAYDEPYVKVQVKSLPPTVSDQQFLALLKKKLPTAGVTFPSNRIVNVKAAIEAKIKNAVQANPVKPLTGKPGMYDIEHAVRYFVVNILPAKVKISESRITMEHLYSVYTQMVSSGVIPGQIVGRTVTSPDVTSQVVYIYIQPNQ